LHTFWPTAELEASNNPLVFPKAKSIELPSEFEYLGNKHSAEEFLKDSRTTGFLVIQNDSIVYEKYYLGNTETTQNISWSMAKSFISALIGIAVQEGHIESVMENVEVYCPNLKGSGYEGVRIKEVLQMSTGVGFNEDYGDFYSDINRWGRGFALGQSQDDFAATLKREIEPGTVNHYVSINTHVLGMILTAATGKTITEYMQEKLWSPAGMEHKAFWLIDGNNMEMALGGLNATLRDFAKIGSLYLHDGKLNGNQIVPNNWVRLSTQADSPHIQAKEGQLGYGYQWWLPYGTEKEFLAQGVYNQNVYVNPSTNTVIAKLSANHRFNENDFLPSHTGMALALFRKITKQFKLNEIAAEEL